MEHQGPWQIEALAGHECTASVVPLAADMRHTYVASAVSSRQALTGMHACADPRIGVSSVDPGNDVPEVGPDKLAVEELVREEYPAEDAEGEVEAGVGELD